MQPGAVSLRSSTGRSTLIWSFEEQNSSNLGNLSFEGLDPSSSGAFVSLIAVSDSLTLAIASMSLECELG